MTLTDIEWSLDLRSDTTSSRADWIDRVHPEDRERVSAKIDAAVSGSALFGGLSYRVQHADGCYVRVLDRWSVVRDHVGRPERLVGHVVTLSDLGGNDAARLRLALAAGDIGTWDWDLVTRRRGCDDRFRAIVGLSADQTDLGDVGFGPVHADDRERVEVAIANAVALVDDGEFDQNFRVLWADGRVRWVAAKGKAVTETDGIGATRFLGTIADATDRHRIEFERARLLAAERSARADAERANRAKAEFLAAMSHELRTPLNAIAGYVELLEMEVHGPLTDPQRDDLRRVRQASGHLLRLISDILDFARVEASRVELRLRDARLDATLGEAMEMIMPQARTKGVDVVFDGCDPQVTVRGDAERVRQILLNLLSNAVKFTRAGGTVTLSGDAVGAQVRIAVRDTGRGIAVDNLAAIFEPFVQVGRSLAAGEHGGIGLGLAISRELARRMQGDLTVQSVHGAGSTFTLSLPAGASA